MKVKTAFRIYKILHGFDIRIGLPHKLALWIARKLMKLPKPTKAVIEHGWAKQIKESDHE